MEPDFIYFSNPRDETTEHVIYIEETRLWYRNGATPLNVRVISRGEKIPPLPSVAADSYLEAFEAMYGHPIHIPAPVREHRKEVLA